MKIDADNCNDDDKNNPRGLRWNDDRYGDEDEDEYGDGYAEELRVRRMVIAIGCRF